MSNERRGKRRFLDNWMWIGWGMRVLDRQVSLAETRKVNQIIN
jgi:hypothetical protein